MSSDNKNLNLKSLEESSSTVRSKELVEKLKNSLNKVVRERDSLPVPLFWSALSISIKEIKAVKDKEDKERFLRYISSANGDA